MIIWPQTGIDKWKELIGRKQAAAEARQSNVPVAEAKDDIIPTGPNTRNKRKTQPRSGNGAANNNGRGSNVVTCAAS